MAPTHPTQSIEIPTSPRSRRPAWPLLIVVLLLVVAGALIAVRLTTGGSTDQRVSIPLGTRQNATVKIDSGADLISVTTADLGSDLVVVTTPGGERGGVRPRAQLDGDQLRVWTDDTGSADEGATVQIDVRIAQGVRWDVLVGKGAKDIRLALGSGKVNTVELRGGADRAEVSLPAPVGEQAVRIPTGLATANLHVPPAVATKVSFGSGAGQMTLDGATKQGIAAGVTVYGANGKGGKAGEKGYTASKNRLAVDVSAGVGQLSLDRATS